MRWSSLFVAAFLAALAVSEAAPPPAEKPVDPADRWSCGDEPKEPCPLQAFMTSVVSPAMKRKDFAAVEKYLGRLADMAPPHYSGWTETAREGAAAAQSGSIDQVRAACARCHRSHKDRYQLELRDRPLPTVSSR